MERLACLKSGCIETRSPDCPPDPVWIELAAGLRPVESEQLINHASQCDHCGALLRQSVEDFTESTTAHEELFLSSLSSPHPSWQALLAQKLGCEGEQQALSHENAIALLVGRNEKFTPLAESSRPGSASTSAFLWAKRFFYQTRLIFAAATLVALAIAGWLSMPLLHPSAQRLLAQAYTEHRTMEMRIPGAQYAPLRVERGDAGSNLDKPESLLRAEALIAQKLDHHPNDPTWLQYKARADLLDGNYESAIQSLQQALTMRPDSPELLTDLGSAYFLRAKSSAPGVGYGNAIDCLSKALAKSPNNTIALFNRALAYEPLFLYPQAKGDWEHYLRVAPEGQWADEARKHLASVTNKLERREKSFAEPLLMPEDTAPADIEEKTSRDRIDKRIDNRPKLEVTTSLFKAFSQSASRTTQELEIAISTPAAIAQERRDGSWLADLLTCGTERQLRAAIRALAVLKDNERTTIGGPRRRTQWG